MLGVLWSLLPPLAQLLVLVFLFRKVVPLNIDAYPAFVFSALLPWVWFSSCLTSAGGLLINNRDLVRRPNFYPSTLILVNTLSNLIHYILFLPILVLILALYHRGLTVYVLFYPFLVIIQGVFIVALSLMIATLNVFYRDVQYMANLGVMLLFYLTPVFYEQHVFGQKYWYVYAFNPMAVLTEGYRSIFFHGVPPNGTALLLAGGMALLLLVLGRWTYNRYLHDVIDAL